MELPTQSMLAQKVQFSNINTDFDEDGCRDGFEDEDDDGDGISNVIDDCPRSIGVVNVNGCSATQVLDEGDTGGSAVYYVCSTGKSFRSFRLSTTRHEQYK